MKYNKQPLDIPALLAMLKARGLAIGDDQEAGRILGLVSYFRLANYLRPMEADKETHQYNPSSSFENAVALYIGSMQHCVKSCFAPSAILRLPSAQR